MPHHADHHLSLIDLGIHQFDRALRSLTPNTQVATRASPAEAVTDGALDPAEQKHAAGLMRVNHTGEVCAQALYQGQSLTARLPQVRDEMETAADEEIDHLAWCEQRLRALDSRPSLLNPLWYGLSFGLGAAAGLASDKVSLGFVAATEERVCQHLEQHLQSLPDQDHKSRAVVSTMIQDEKRHGQNALAAGGWPFPQPVKQVMSAVAKVMTATSYRF